MMKRGFTLIELSIVLVIVGLIIGGVLTGRDLIRASEIRAQVSQLEKFSAAANGFRTKYNYLPGDITGSVASQYGFAVRTGTTADGDGNALLEGCWYGGSQMFGCETAQFWEDLGMAKMINGDFSAIGNSAGNPVVFASNPERYLPTARVGAGAYIGVFTGGMPYFTYSAGQTGKNYFFLSVVTQASDDYYMSAALNPKDAYAIDKKIDDAMPGTGTVQSLIPTMPGHNFVAPDYTAIPIYNPGTFCGSATGYNVSGTTGNAVICDLMIQMQ